MKLLFDPIYTGDVNRCASTTKMKNCALHILEHFPDTFIYWMVPKEMNDEEREWLPKDERIRYIEMQYFLDRYKEYWHASEEYRRAVAFSGELWDIDLAVTNRTTLVPFLKWAMLRPGGQIDWSKFVFLIEDMPIMSFKMFIPQSSKREGDMATLLGYMSANKTCISAYWEKKHILNIAKKYMSPSSVKYISDTMIESSSHIHHGTRLKTRESIERMLNKERKFTVSYAGRMVNRDFVDDSFDILLNHWIIGGDDVRMILCTVSESFGRVKHPAIKLIEVMRPNREEFWRIMREESDVGVFMSRDEDYSMAMMEPLMQGTPIVIYRAEHAVASVGADYPFFVDSIKEGYAMVKAFKDNYVQMYAKFAAWSKNSFTKLLTERNKDYIPLHLANTVQDWHKALQDSRESLENNEIVQLIAEHSPEGPFNVVEMIKLLEKKKLIRGQIAGKDDRQFDKVRLTFSTHYDVFRLGLLKLGFKDAAPIPGVMIKPPKGTKK